MRAFRGAQARVTRLAARRVGARCLAWPPLVCSSRRSLIENCLGYIGDSAASLSTCQKGSPQSRVPDDIIQLEVDARALVADAPRVKKASEVARLLKRLPVHSAMPRAEAVLALVAPHVPSCADFSSRAIADALYGLNKFGMDVPGMTLMLSAMHRHIIACRDDFSARDVSMSLYGLRRCKGKLGVAHVCGVLNALSWHIERCKEPLSAQGVGNSLYGLQGCSSQHAEVRAVLSALAPQIERCMEPLSAQETGNALYGLQGCSSQHIELRAVLSALAPQIER